MAEVSFISGLQLSKNERREKRQRKKKLIGVYLPLIGMHDALNIK